MKFFMCTIFVTWKKFTKSTTDRKRKRINETTLIDYTTNAQFTNGSKLKLLIGNICSVFI